MTSKPPSKSMPVPKRTNGMSAGPTLKPLFLLRVVAPHLASRPRLACRVASRASIRSVRRRALRCRPVSLFSDSGTTAAAATAASDIEDNRMRSN